MKVLCYHCHLHWWHKNPVEAGLWFQKTYPERWAYLESQPRLAKFSIPDLEDKVTDLQSQLAALQEKQTIE